MFDLYTPTYLRHRRMQYMHTIRMQRRWCAGARGALVTVALLLAGGGGCVYAGRSRVYPMGAVMGITARGLRAAGRPDMVLDYASQPLCGRAGPDILPFGRERLASTPFRVRMGVDETRVAACVLDTSPVARAQYAELASGGFQAVLVLDGLEAGGYPVAATSGNVTMLATHIDLVLYAHSMNNNTSAQLVRWSVRTAGAYVPISSAGHAWTYSVTWHATNDVRGEDGGLSADAGGAQLIGVAACIFFTLVASSAITTAVRRLVAPHLIPGTSVLCPKWLTRGGNVIDATAAPSSSDELVVLMSDASTDPTSGRWRLLADDVFHDQPASRTLCTLTGVGVHILVTAACTVTICVAGFAHLAGTLVWLLAMPAGVPAGYATAKTHVALGTLPSRRDVVVSALSVPALLVGCVFSINIALASEASELAAPPLKLLWLTCAWAIPTVCATITGYAIHAHNGTRPRPVSRSTRLRAGSPPKSDVATVAASAVTCVAVFLGAAAPAYTLLDAVWLGLPLTATSAYVLIAVCMLAWCMLVAACALLVTYTVLDSGNWNWAPYAFFVPASSGAMVAALAGIYYAAGSFAGGVGAFVFTCEAVGIAACFGVAAGALSMLVACRFVSVLYTTSHCA